MGPRYLFKILGRITHQFYFVLAQDSWAIRNIRCIILAQESLDDLNINGCSVLARDPWTESMDARCLLRMPGPN